MQQLKNRILAGSIILAELQQSKDIHKNVVAKLKCCRTYSCTCYESALHKYFFKKSLFT